MTNTSQSTSHPRSRRVKIPYPEPGGAVLTSPDEPPPNPTLSVCFEDLPWRAQIAALRGLRDGYGGPGTVAPSERAIRGAESLLHITTFPIRSVYPDGKGGILITYQNGKQTAIFEDPPDSGNWWIEFSPAAWDLHGRRALYRLGEERQR